MIDRIVDTLSVSRWQAQLVLTLAVILVLFVARLIVLRIVHRRVEDVATWYRTRKVVSYVITVVAVIVLASIWLEGQGVGTYIGLLTAGIAIALSDVLKNLAGWFYIVLRRPFRLGDRVEIAGRAGDVVDVRAFRFSLLEIGGRVDADQSTGRLMHVPNGLVFTEPLANFTEGFGFLWHEIPVLVTFESDWSAAERIIRDVLIDNAPDASEMQAAQELRRTQLQYQIKYTHLTPTVYLTVRDSGVLLTGRVLTPARGIRRLEDIVWKGILTGFKAHGSIDLAYPTIRAFYDPQKAS